MAPEALGLALAASCVHAAWIVLLARARMWRVHWPRPYPWAWSNELGLTFAIGCRIAGYTLVDRYGVRHANPPGYLELVLIGPAVVYPVLALRRSASVLRLRPGTAALAAGAA
jgi:hypothetical protein